MRRMIVVSMVLLLAFISVSCGQPEAIAPVDSSAATAEPVKEEPQASETTDPNMAIVFNDDALESGIRKAMNRPDGDILVSDALAVTELDLQMDGSDWSIPRIHNLDALRYFTNLASLNLSWAVQRSDGPVDLSPLSGLMSLVDLQLACTEVSDLSPLSSLIHLNSLQIWGCRNITDISFVSSLKELQNFQVNGNYVSDISPLAELPEIQYLNLDQNVIQDVTPLLGLTKLKKLMLSDNLIEDYSPLAAIYPNLEEKDFSLEDVPQPIDFKDPVLERKIREAMQIPEGDITISQTKEVFDLQLGNPWQETIPDDIKITDISALKYFPNLFGLSIFFNGISNIEVLRAMPNLGILDLNGNPIQSIVPIENCKKLSWLNLDGTDANDLSPLRGLTQLETLSLNYIAGLGSIEPISTLTNLKELRLQNVMVDLSPIASLKNLTTLYLTDGYDGDLSALKEIYPNLKDKNFKMP